MLRWLPGSPWSWILLSRWVIRTERPERSSGKWSEDVARSSGRRGSRDPEMKKVHPVNQSHPWRFSGGQRHAWPVHTKGLSRIWLLLTENNLVAFCFISYIWYLLQLSRCFNQTTLDHEKIWKTWNALGRASNDKRNIKVSTSMNSSWLDDSDPSYQTCY